MEGALFFRSDVVVVRARASDTTATAVNAPFRRIVRKAYRRSCQSIPHFHGHYTVY